MTKLSRFIGRSEELHSLEKLFKKNSSSLVVIQGRRRIGKSRLVEEFAKNKKFFEFSGLAPSKSTTKQSQLDEFARQLNHQTGLPEVKVDDWSKLFILLAEKIKQEKVVVLFDEISWMGSKDPDFLGKLKNAWDIYFKKNSELVFVLCGSVSVWIEKNILSSTGFLGRISYRLNLEELALTDCNKFWKNAGGIISAYEKLKLLMITGGVPRYLEEIKPNLTAEENIKDLCFERGGALVNEFDEIFSDLFSTRASTTKKIVLALSLGALELKNIGKKIDLEVTGFLSECMDDLVKSGFVTRDYMWHLNSNKVSRISFYRLSDNYIRFYLKYIDKNKLKIENNEYAFKSLSLLPNWEIILGLQFENLVLKNRLLIKKYLKLNSDEIISDNPYTQRKTTKTEGCQIDYLIHTKFNTLYMCEIKFKKNIIGKEIILEMKKKMKTFHFPKGFSCRPILIHANGVHEDVLESGFFSDIIDFSSFLES